MRILVAGVGNIFLQDDGFGSAVAQYLRTQALPEDTTVIDFGTGSIHLAFELQNGYDGVLILDTVSRGGIPGTLYVIEPELPIQAAPGIPDPHGAHPGWALQVLATLPQRPQYVRIIGCEPASLAEELGLTPTVAAAVPLAASLVLEQIAAWTHDATKKGGDVCSGDS